MNLEQGPGMPRARDRCPHHGVRIPWPMEWHAGVPLWVPYQDQELTTLGLVVHPEGDLALTVSQPTAAPQDMATSDWGSQCKSYD
ncbi:hypothetical protein SKAU_G00040320 [Synaphobranchus kaupii]|uniref:Uncharacterized protein n=1 Tax=Synaphobranchus kaupii TaxID=118154 RepID=A0A9Q1G1X7_SYNKA|nr:hypothetical protein SKAU_G00040320 [Synaphobranchus kaupii]